MRITLFAFLLCFSVSNVDAQDPRPIKILTWNIYMRPASIFWNGQFKRAKAIGQILKQEDYNIILFQEAFGKTSRRKLRKALGPKYPFEIEPEKHKALTNNGLWILSKHEVKRSEIIFYENCLVGDCQSSKGAVLIEVEINGQLYQVINTHVQAEDGKAFAEVRNTQFEQIRKLLDDNHQKNIPQFILGDLNTDKDSKVNYAKMLETLDATDGTISVSDVESMKKPATWHADKNDLIATKWNGISQLLDYGLQRNGLYQYKLRRELKVYTRQWSRKHQNLSDHYAISLSIFP
ncbi:MAG: sphingomyelin phosphodiesterase [Flavobacteriales bacterium]|nr:sphingomyelin phosphodiesterase [Flavobacteriales bacterium]